MRYVIDLTEEEFEIVVARGTARGIREHKPENKESIRPKYATRQQVRDEIHVSFPTLNRLDKEGILTAQKIGGRVLYLWSDVEKAINPDQPLKYRRARV